MKKILLGIGTIATVVAPVASVVACGSSSHKNETVDGYRQRVIKFIKNYYNANGDKFSENSLHSIIFSETKASIKKAAEIFLDQNGYKVKHNAGMVKMPKLPELPGFKNSLEEYKSTLLDFGKEYFEQGFDFRTYKPKFTPIDLSAIKNINTWDEMKRYLNNEDPDNYWKSLESKLRDSYHRSVSTVDVSAIVLPKADILPPVSDNDLAKYKASLIEYASHIYKNKDGTGPIVAAVMKQINAATSAIDAYDAFMVQFPDPNIYWGRTIKLYGEPVPPTRVSKPENLPDLSVAKGGWTERTLGTFENKVIALLKNHYLDSRRSTSLFAELQKGYSSTIEDTIGSYSELSDIANDSFRKSSSLVYTSFRNGGTTVPTEEKIIDEIEKLNDFGIYDNAGKITRITSLKQDKYDSWNFKQIDSFISSLNNYFDSQHYFLDSAGTQGLYITKPMSDVEYKLGGNLITPDNYESVLNHYFKYDDTVYSVIPAKEVDVRSEILSKVPFPRNARNSDSKVSEFKTKLVDLFKDFKNVNVSGIESAPTEARALEEANKLFRYRQTFTKETYEQQDKVVLPLPDTFAYYKFKVLTKLANLFKDKECTEPLLAPYAVSNAKEDFEMIMNMTKSQFNDWLSKIKGPFYKLPEMSPSEINLIKTVYEYLDSKSYDSVDESRSAIESKYPDYFVQIKKSRGMRNPEYEKFYAGIKPFGALTLDYISAPEKLSEAENIETHYSGGKDDGKFGFHHADILRMHKEGQKIEGEEVAALDLTNIETSYYDELLDILKNNLIGWDSTEFSSHAEDDYSTLKDSFEEIWNKNQDKIGDLVKATDIQIPNF